MVCDKCEINIVKQTECVICYHLETLGKNIENTYIVNCEQNRKNKI